MSVNSKEMLSAERVAEMVQRYQRRLEINKRWAKRHYDANAQLVKQKRLLAGVAKGRCPSEKTVERLAIDREQLIKAWKMYVSSQQELPSRARAFHRQLVGAEWQPDSA